MPVCRQRHRKYELFAGYRMVKGQLRAAEPMPAGRIFGTVQGVAGKRIADGGEMHPDLMGATGV